MAATRPSAVTPNRRGAQSRVAVLDAAERLMSEHGYDAATVSAIVEESGIPMSSVYHYYGSKDGVLLAVMERGADRFFSELPTPTERIGGSATDHLIALTSVLLETLDRNPNFLRLLIVFATQPTSAGNDEVQRVVSTVRSMALDRLRIQLGLAFDDDPTDPTIARLAAFTLATIDGAFVAQQSGLGAEPADVMLPLAAAVEAIRDELRAADATASSGRRPSSRRGKPGG